MKNLSASLFFGLIILFSLSTCSKEDKAVSECGLTRLSVFERNFDMGGAAWRESLYLNFEGTECLDSICSFFKINLSNHPNYSFNYFLLLETNGSTDTLQGQESGTYALSYCNSGDTGALAGPSNSGTITFSPQADTPYSLPFAQQSHVISIGNFELRANDFYSIYLNPI